ILFPFMNHVCSNCCAHFSDSTLIKQHKVFILYFNCVHVFGLCHQSNGCYTMFDVFYLFLIGLQCRLQGVSELSQLLSLAVLSLFDLQRKRNSNFKPIVVFAQSDR
uniref:Uncharacterized protein n=1 Tax=Haplochromis burtoni TaxID=8153 RepID=A0A3Q3CNZ9_HAPBU